MATASEILRDAPLGQRKKVKRRLLKVQLVSAALTAAFFFGGAALIGVPTWFYFAHPEVLDVPFSQASREIGAYFMAPFGALIGSGFGLALGSLYVEDARDSMLDNVLSYDVVWGEDG